ncbi:MAG: DUF6516 family protein [Atribacterota bacterium]|nr:DUF6516 family protein [Atribacterota bacterium]
MLRTLTLVEENRAVKSHEIQDFKQGRNFYYIKLKVMLVDGSELYVREYVSENEYVYSYHWQWKSGELRIRWDNAPYHRDVRTFPHHKHTPGLVESEEITLEDVLQVIERELQIEG